VTAARFVTVAAGVALAGYGVVLLVTTSTLPQLFALTLWLAAVVIVHDAVLTPSLSALRARWYRASGARPAGVTRAVQVGFMVGAVLTAFVAPAIWAQSRDHPNPTILVGDYAARLLAVWAGIAAVVLVIARVLIRRSRR
jgi:hypothetical protein